MDDGNSGFKVGVFQSTLKPLWNHFKTTFQPFWNHFEATLKEEKSSERRVPVKFRKEEDSP